MSTRDLLRIEPRGLEPVPEEERHGNPRGLFGMWWGGQFTYVSIVIGALPVILGLSLFGSLTAIFVGGLMGSVAVGLGSVLGPRTHTATIVNTRSVFGIKGNIPIEGLNSITIIGWAAVNSVLAALAFIELFAQAGWHGTAAKIVAVAVVVVGQAAVALVGRDAVESSEKVFAVISTVLIVGVLIFLTGHLHWGYAGAGLAGKAAVGTWLLAVALVFTGPLSWANYASDYTRYYPDETSSRKIVGIVTGSMFLSTMLCYGIGALLATAVDMNDPVANLPGVLPGWYLWPFLFVVIWSCVANNVLNVYSAGLALLACHVNIKRSLSVVMIGAVTAGLAYYAIFASNFVTTFMNFLSLQLLWLAPWLVLELLEYRYRNGRFDVDALHEWGRGSYWFHKGWNWRNLTILVISIGASIPFANSAWIHTSFSRDTLGGADLSFFVGMFVAAVLSLATRERAGDARVRPLHLSTHRHAA